MSECENPVSASVGLKCGSDNKECHEDEKLTEVITQNESLVETEENVGKPSPVEDPYAYIEQNGFTSEKFKIEIRHLPKYYGISELRKLLNGKLGLNCSKIKSPGPRSYWVYACFRSEEDRQKSLNVLDKYKWKGATFEAKVADPAPDPLVKRRNEDRTGENKNKKIKLETVEDQDEALKNSATPLWNIAYEDQLKEKQKDAECLLRRLGGELIKTNKELTTWLDKQKKMHNGLPCKMLDTIALPECSDYYRNKCEFSVGKNDLTGEKTVGFRLGSYASGSLCVAPVKSLKNFSQRMFIAVEVFEKFVRDSDLEVFAPETLKGHWRQLTVRVGTKTGDMMLIVGFHPQQLSQQELEEVKSKLKLYFSEGDGAQANVKSLYFQILKRKESGEETPKPELLLGDAFIEESLYGLRFKISPQSFFQVNTLVFETLLESVRDMVGLGSDTTLLDVYCGTGTIGLSLAKHCGKVLGIEVFEEAVKDAKENASLNKIDNCEFFCGKADDILASVASLSTSQSLVAIVDPPRAGLHQKAVVLLRRIKNLEKIVYFSCDPKSAFKNFTEFGRAKSKTLQSPPFVPVSAVVVDMFPHTKHYELVMCFQRCDLL